MVRVRVRLGLMNFMASNYLLTNVIVTYWYFLYTGFTLPGTTVVCGDSHTSTHGAFGALAFGIGTSEVEHTLATQTLSIRKSKNMRITVDGKLPTILTSKDVVLHIIGVIGTAGGTGHVIEFAGECVRDMSMEARMSMCNMAIEAGARAGMVAPDEKTFAYVKGKPMAPQTQGVWDKAISYWKTLYSDEGAVFDKEVVIQTSDVGPTLTWGTSPEQVIPITGIVPDSTCCDATKKDGIERALEYMGLKANSNIDGIKIDKVFIGSCTNSRIEDLRLAAAVAKGKSVNENVYAMIVPGSGLVKRQAELEGLHKIFVDAGFDWREAGCSMCLGMNPDQLKPKERCASTSNRNFEGRQGYKGRTHLMSPAMAAAAAITGTLTDVRKLDLDEKLITPYVGGVRGTIELEQDGDANKINPAEDVVVVTKEIGGCSNGDSSTSTSRKATAASDDKKFDCVKGVAVPLNMSNVDTDMILPKQFLKTVKKTGLGNNVFHDMRYDENGEPMQDFVLNQDKYKHSKILISRKNFGCGSSREHAPWALKDFGIVCIIANSFADIFNNNCTKNGMLPVALDSKYIDLLMDDAHKGLEVEIDLAKQTVCRHSGDVIEFQVDSIVKNRLLNGLDDIAVTLSKEKEIAQFESMRSGYYPWLDGATLHYKSQDNAPNNKEKLGTSKKIKAVDSKEEMSW